MEFYLIKKLIEKAKAGVDHVNSTSGFSLRKIVAQNTALD